MIIVDPPSGWKYGFPKRFTFKPSHPNLPGEEYDQELKRWFIDNGYPRADVQLAMRYSRYWQEGDAVLDPLPAP